MIKSNKNAIVELNKSDKKVITIWGNTGTGKSCFAAQLSIAIANRGIKVLVADFNTISPALDHYFGVSKEPQNIAYKISNDEQGQLANTSLSYIYDAIERDIFEPSVLREVCIKHPKVDNLHILTGSYLLNQFEMLNTKHFQAIIDAARKIYDIIILDTNSVVFVDSTFVALQNADIIYTLTEADYTGVRDVNRLIDYLTTYISKDKYKLVLNKYTKKHLDLMTVNQILEPIKVAETIEYNDKYITSKINKNPFILNCNSKEKKVFEEIVNKVIC